MLQGLLHKSAAVELPALFAILWCQLFTWNDKPRGSIQIRGNARLAFRPSQRSLRYQRSTITVRDSPQAVRRKGTSRPKPHVMSMLRHWYSPCDSRYAPDAVL